jgi:hypothetical protein
MLAHCPHQFWVMTTTTLGAARRTLSGNSPSLSKASSCSLVRGWMVFMLSRRPNLARIRTLLSWAFGVRALPSRLGPTLRPRGQRIHDAGLRGDVIRWLDESEATDRSFLTMMEELRIGLNQQLFLGLFHYECRYAVYGVGAHYDRHLDTLAGQKNRLLS